MDEFRYLGSSQRLDQDSQTIEAAFAQLQMPSWSVVVNRELSQKAGSLLAS